LWVDIYLRYKSLPEEKKLEVRNKLTNNETIVMDWQPPESSDEIAWQASMKKLKEISKQ
jgi:hypothetical protein